MRDSEKERKKERKWGDLRKISGDGGGGRCGEGLRIEEVQIDSTAVNWPMVRIAEMESMQVLMPFDPSSANLLFIEPKDFFQEI